MVSNGGNSRIIGYDLARSIAVFFMMIINFSCVFSQYESSPNWLWTFVERIEGRAAALFVILAGVGISLLTRNTVKGDRSCVYGYRRKLVLRSAFLFAAGVGLSTTWPGDILHYYGLYLLMAAFLFTQHDKALLWLASAFPFLFTGFVLCASAGDLVLVYFPEWHSVRELAVLIPNSLFKGCYPVVPWMSFILIGMWIGRRNVREPKLRRRLFVGGLAATLMAESVSRLFLSAFPAGSPTFLTIPVRNLWFPLFNIRHCFGTNMSPPVPLFVISAAGSAMCVLVSCLYISETLNRKWLRPFLSVGRMALTIYVAHVIFGINAILYFGGGPEEPILFSAGWAVAYYCFFAVFCTAWLKRFDSGPLEYLMRRLSASTVPKKAAPPELGIPL